MMKAVIYTRVSTDEQARNNLSLKGQEDAALKYCKENSFEVAEIFREEGESAKTTNRPKLKAALNYCSDNYKNIDYFIVWKLDRLARKTEDHLSIKTMLRKHAIKIDSVTEVIEDTPSGRLMETMLASYAQFDNEVRGERSTAGLRRRIEEGGWPHLAPLGYQNVKDVLGRPTIEPIESAARIKQWLLEFHKGGYTLKAANDLAFTMGIRSRLGKRLSYQQTCNMLRNPVYAGIVSSKMLDAPVKGLHKPLISLEVHEGILDVVDGRSKTISVASTTAEWPLRGGFLKCGECSESLTGSAPKGRTKHYAMYHCPKCRSKVVGHRVSVSKDIIHGEFEALLESITPTEAHLRLFREVFVKKWRNIHVDQRKQQKELLAQQEVLEARKSRVMDMFIDGQLTADEKQTQTSRLDTELLGITMKLGEVKEAAVDAEVVIDFGINMIQNMPKLWRTASEVDRRRLQVAVFPEGITYNFDKGFGTVKTSELYEVVGQIGDKNTNVVGVAGLEPATNRL